MLSQIVHPAWIIVINLENFSQTNDLFDTLKNDTYHDECNFRDQICVEACIMGHNSNQKFAYLKVKKMIHQLHIRCLKYFCSYTLSVMYF